MARKRKADHTTPVRETAEVTLQPITETIEKNYMPYVMSVIVSRALPDIDGFKPSHRKLLYTMYTMGLLTGARTKSANVVGQTMHLNPHGDAAIYDTLVRLTRGCEALLHPFVDSKGSFGKQYSKDMAYAASRYTEVKLAPICNELFGGIGKDAVDMVPNYDNSTTEPTLLPTTFPNILVSPNLGIAVGMACSICSFNLGEICDGTIAILRNPNVSMDRILDIIKAPDFPGGALLIYDREQMRRVYETGTGPIRLRARYRYDAAENTIDILQIPYSTTIEDIMDKITDLVKTGKIKDITDVRDAIDLNGFKLSLDLRRGTDPDKLMAKLYKLTPLEDNFSCNFNILIDGTPRQLGVIDILKEWIRFRMQCVKRELTFDLNKKRDKLHLVLGLTKILLDIDKAVSIVRYTEKEDEVVPNLMRVFDIDEVQAEYIAEIKLRHLNREYIMNRIKEANELQEDIARLEEILGDELKIKNLIAEQLKEIKKKYGEPRKTQLISADEIIQVAKEDLIENYPVRLILTHDGYFKKITLQSLRGNDEQNIKEGDYILSTEDTDNLAELIIFTNHARVFKAKVSEFDTMKASALGDFLPVRFNMEDGERPALVKANPVYDDRHHVVLIFENGKGVRVSMDNYVAERKRLVSAFSTASPLTAAFYEDQPFDILMISNVHRAILLSSALIPAMATKSASGVTLLQMKKGTQHLAIATTDYEGNYQQPERYRKKKIPANGVLLAEKDIDLQQIRFDS